MRGRVIEELFRNVDNHARQRITLREMVRQKAQPEAPEQYRVCRRTASQSIEALAISGLLVLKLSSAPSKTTPFIRRCVSRGESITAEVHSRCQI
jgi:hypothetical protein